MYSIIIQKSNNSRGKNKLSNKKLLIIILIIGILFITISSYGRKPISYTEIKIKEGDTLWKIVKSLNLNDTDPRKLINEIKKVNNMENVVLQPGQTIKIPEF